MGRYGERAMFSSVKEDWYTPRDFFAKLDAEFHFTLDPASSHDNALCEKHYTEEEDGLSQSWGGETVFVNPPYCHKTKYWVHKCYEESKQDNTVIVALLPCRPDVGWFHDYVLGKAEVRFIRGRLKFGGSKQSAPFPSMICIWR